jgi:DNA repair protein RadC
MKGQPEARGVGTCREVRLSYGPSLGPRIVVRGPDDVAPLLRLVICDDPREHFVALHLDARHAVTGARIVSIGTASAALVHPREVFQAAIVAGACGLIVGHNHPTGNPSPSSEDEAITRRLALAGWLLGIRLLDSVIVGELGVHSLQASHPELFKEGPG